MATSILGTAVRRVEDPELLTGAARYVADLVPDDAAHLVFVRSPMARAQIVNVDTARALRAPGVLAVATAADLGLRRFSSFLELHPDCARPPLAEGSVHFVGDPIVAVVATSLPEALDAAELVTCDLEPLPAVVDPEEALGPTAEILNEALGSNVAAGYSDPAAATVLDGAQDVVALRVRNQRVAPSPMEGNAILVVPGDDGQGHELVVFVSTQMPHGVAAQLSGLIDVPLERLRVVAPWVGGAFGGKAGLLGEHLVAVALSRRLGRSVAWIESRSENLVAMPHGRGQVDWVEVGFDADRRITGMRVRALGEAGAYGGFGGGLVLGPTRLMSQGVYRVPKLAFEAAAVLTNTTPMGAFRGAGRPEAALMLERVMDLAAAELGCDPAELRRRNLLRADELPITTKTGARYDSGDYVRALELALELADYESLRAEQARRRAQGDRLALGIGLATYVEVTAGAGSEELGQVRVEQDGTVSVAVGTSSHGQGHATAFAAVVAERLGVELSAVRFVQSDTAAVPRGGGTGGSRSLQLAGSALLEAAEQVVEVAKELAARRMEAAAFDVVLDDGRFEVAGVPARSVGWAEVLDQARQDGVELRASVDFEQRGATFPFGAHVAVVEVDTETGAVRPLRHVAVDDCGRIVNPLLVAGQQHGGIAQGMAQALFEEVVYDHSGTLRTATLADYAVPSAAELPSFEVSSTETPTPLNPLGAKGIGESGTIGATPAVLNAVVDAVSHLGVRHLDMPCTPERVWRAIQDARAGRGASSWTPPPEVFSTLPPRDQARASRAAGADV